MSAAEAYAARRRSAPLFERVAFKTSRLAEFCGQREVVAQTGHPVEDWPLVILKELVDNALDACEEAEIAPEINIEVSTARRDRHCRQRTRHPCRNRPGRSRLFVSR